MLDVLRFASDVQEGDVCIIRGISTLPLDVHSLSCTVQNRSMLSASVLS